MGKGTETDKLYKTLFLQRLYGGFAEDTKGKWLETLKEKWDSEYIKTQSFIAGVHKAEYESRTHILAGYEILKLGSEIKSVSNKSLQTMELLGYQSAIGYLNFIKEREKLANHENRYSSSSYLENTAYLAEAAAKGMQMILEDDK